MAMPLRRSGAPGPGDITITLPQPHAAQAAILGSAARFNVVCCGRRVGKTTMGATRMAQLALEHPVAWGAPTYRELSQTWDMACNLLAPVIVQKNKSEKQIRLSPGGLIDFYSFDRENSIRGKKYMGWFLDEAALIKRLISTWHAVIRPTLADYAPESEAWFFSTPQGRNDFHALYMLAQDNTPGWASWHYPTWANPYIPRAEIDDMRAGLPERVFLQEIEAVFLDDSNAIFRRIKDASYARPQSEAQPGHNYAMAVDWARSHDYTVIAVLDLTTNELCFIDRFTDIEYAVQIDRVNTAYQRFKPQVIMSEYNSIGGPLSDQLGRAGLPVSPQTTTNATKAAWVDALALAFEQGEIAILDDPVLHNELMGFEAKRLPSGLMRYAAPEGGHDDMVMALLLLWQARQDNKPLVLW